MANAPIPAWKFWHPLPLWKLFAAAIVLQFVCILPLVALREFTGINIPEYLTSGLAGGLTFVVVRMWAARQAAS